MSNRTCPPRGVTLLELLVVVFIITLVVAAATSVLRPLMENSQLREASRMVNATLNTARSESIEKRRTVGVMFRPLGANVNASMDMVYVEAPPPYGGDTQTSRIQFTADPAPIVGSNPPSAVLTATFPQNDAWASQVFLGDSLQLNYQGNQYLITAIDATNPAIPKFTVTCVTVTRWPLKTASGDPGAAFQFYHQPQQLTASMPVQLPQGAAIDLRASGIGDQTFVPTTTQAIMVTFTPTGQLNKVFYPGFPQGQIPTDTVFLLVGRPENVGTSNNLKDLRCNWVSIACQSGLIGVDSNAFVTGGNPDVAVPADCKSARRFAASGSAFGG